MSQFPIANPELEQSQRNPFQEMQSIPGPGELPPSYWHFSSIDKNAHLPRFHQLGPRDGKVSGADVKPVLVESGLMNDQLAQIWRLSDFDNDGYMDIDEFCIAVHLIKAVQNGAQLPEKLPATLMPNRKF
jgi:EH domain-containing protein 3/EH domain-containing protein 1